eukprot:CFRG7374T1
MNCSWEGYEVVPEDVKNKTIATVNGLEALEYFRKIAYLNGNYKDDGARLNSLIASGLSTNTAIVPDFRTTYNDTIMNVEFTDGSTAIVKPMVVSVSNTTSTDEILILGTTPKSEFSQEVVKFYEGIMEQRVHATTASISDDSSDNQKENNRKSLNVEHVRRSHDVFRKCQDTQTTRNDERKTFNIKTSTDPSHMTKVAMPTSNGRDPLTLLNLTNIYDEVNISQSSNKLNIDSIILQAVYKTPSQHLIKPSLAGYLFNYSGVPVLKFPSFYRGDNTSNFIDDTLDMMDAVMEFATTSDRLVIDLSSNGGGLTALPNVMVSILSGGIKDPQLCPLYDIREGPLVQAWVNLTAMPPKPVLLVTDEELTAFLASVHNTLSFVETIAPQSLKDIASRLKNISAFSNVTIFNSIIENSTVLYDLNPIERADFINSFRSSLLYLASASQLLWTGIPPISVSSFSIAANPKRLADYKPVSPERYWINNANSYVRGGNEGIYSEQTIECLPELEFIAPKGKYPTFKDIVILTDGMCGSACGQFLDSMQSLGMGAYPDLQPFSLTTVAIGGYVNVSISGAAFEGGNVLEDDDFLLQLYINGALLGPIYTSIGPDKAVTAEKYQSILQEMPIPYNNGLVTPFNYRESYVAATGNASLPSEYYHKPTTYHLNEWYPELSRGTWILSSPVNDLYTRLAEGDYSNQ